MRMLSRTRGCNRERILIRVGKAERQERQTEDAEGEHMPLCLLWLSLSCIAGGGNWTT